MKHCFHKRVRRELQEERADPFLLISPQLWATIGPNEARIVGPVLAVPAVTTGVLHVTTKDISITILPTLRQSPDSTRPRSRPLSGLDPSDPVASRHCRNCVVLLLSRCLRLCPWRPRAILCLIRFLPCGSELSLWFVFLFQVGTGCSPSFYCIKHSGRKLVYFLLRF